MKTYLVVLILVLLITLNLHAEDKESTTGGAWIVPVQGEINRSMVVFIRRNIYRAVDEGAGYLIFDIDTLKIIMAISIGVTALATIVIAVYARYSYRLNFQIQVRNDEFRWETINMQKAIVVSNLLDPNYLPDSTRGSEVIKAFNKLYAEATRGGVLFDEPKINK